MRRSGRAGFLAATENFLPATEIFSPNTLREPGGTLPWLKGEITSNPAATGFVLFSHIPMHAGTFLSEEMAQIDAAIAPRRPDVRVDVAGHMHLNYETAEPGHEVWVCAATWTSDQAIRLGHVVTAEDGARVTTELMTIPL